MQCQSHHHQQQPSSSSWYDNSQPHYNAYPRSDYYEECCRSQSNNNGYYEECYSGSNSGTSPPQYDQYHCSEYAAHSQQYSSQYQSHHATQDHYNVPHSRDQYQYIIPNDHYSSREHYSNNNNSTDHYANTTAREQYYSPPQYVQQQPQNNNDSIAAFSSKPLVNPPRWASPAKGESYLEPACSAIPTHSPQSLTTRPYFRIGRAPSSDIPLLHTTCSRRHALLYHDPQGHCYVRDCHSAHGTYVDGRRVHPQRPRRVRRGALLRFGGVEAPSFVLKSFQVGLGDIVTNLGGVTDAFLPRGMYARREGEETSTPTIICESSSIEEDEDATPAAVAATQPATRNYSRVFSHLSHGTVETAKPRLPKEADAIVCIREDGGGLACIAEEMDAPVASLVLLNTRLNAIGDAGLDRETRWLAKRAQDKFSALVAWGRRETTTTKRSWTGGEERATKRRKMGILVTEEKKQTKRNETAKVIHCVPDGAYSYQDIFRSPRRERRVRFSGDEQYEAFQPPIMMCSMSMDSQDLETAAPEKVVVPEVTSSSSRDATPAKTAVVRDEVTPVKAAVVQDTLSQEVTPEKTDTKTSCSHCKTSICSFCKLLDASEEEYAKVNCTAKE